MTRICAFLLVLLGCGTFVPGASAQLFENVPILGDAEREVNRAADRILPGARDAATILTAPVTQPHRAIQSVLPGGVQHDPTRPFELPRVTSPQEAWRNLQTLPQTIGNMANPVAVMLAEAIRRGEQRAMSSCRPVPAFVRNALRNRVSPEVLSRACFSTDWGASQNMSIQQFLLANGMAVAVTLNRVIVFENGNDALSRDESTLELWAHELAHVEQYMRYGVDGFAARYVTNWNQLEGEAEQRAARAVSGLDIDDDEARFDAPPSFNAPRFNAPPRTFRTQPVPAASRHVEPVMSRLPTVASSCVAFNGVRVPMAPGVSLPPGAPCFVPNMWGPPLPGRAQ